MGVWSWQLQFLIIQTSGVVSQPYVVCQTRQQLSTVYLSDARAQTTQDAAKQSHALHDFVRTSAGFDRTSRGKITSSPNDGNADAEGRVSGKSCQLSVQHARRKSVTVALRHSSVSLFLSVTDSWMSLIYDVVDVRTVQACAPANGVSQFDFARTARYFSRNKTGCHFTRHDCSTKLYISYLPVL